MTTTTISGQDLTTLRHALARLLGEGWTHTPNPNHVGFNMEIRGPRGAVINVHTSTERGKIHIGGWSRNYGDTPQYERERAQMPSIRVSYDRGAAVIYREMERRFLPGFWKALADADAYIAERNQQRGKSGETFDAVLSAFGKAAKRSQKNEDGGGTIDAGTVNTGSIDVRVNSADSVEFSVRYLNCERAVRLAAFLSTF